MYYKIHVRFISGIITFDIDLPIDFALKIKNLIRIKLNKLTNYLAVEYPTNRVYSRCLVR